MEVSTRSDEGQCMSIPGLEICDFFVKSLALLLPARLGTRKLRLSSLGSGATFTSSSLTLRQLLLQLLHRLDGLGVREHFASVAVFRSL